MSVIVYGSLIWGLILLASGNFIPVGSFFAFLFLIVLVWSIQAFVSSTNSKKAVEQARVSRIEAERRWQEAKKQKDDEMMKAWHASKKPNNFPSLAERNREYWATHRRVKSATEAREAAERELAKMKPKKPDELTRIWLEGRVKPSPQKFGVSHHGAEELVALWLEYLGQKHVSVTPRAHDGGIDVRTDTIACQVKNYEKVAVTPSEVRELLGAAVSQSLKPMIFTSSKLSEEAERFCEMNGIGAIKYVATTGALIPLNDDGALLMRLGRYDD